MSAARISLLAEPNSLLLITGNRSLRPRKVLRISALVPAEESEVGEFPCIFPGHQGSSWRDEFATDCFHRQLVCRCGDSAAETRVEPRNPGVSAGFRAAGLTNPNRRPRVPGFEEAAVGARLRCQVGRFGFALDSPQRRVGGSADRYCKFQYCLANPGVMIRFSVLNMHPRPPLS